ncbi:hypothetical protein N0V90_007012 [Kalmusia sp. IMI 367209]|nr:hypothetical protein N0V90_007012 [Kalmusia sp. IMI 367209]
MPPKQVYGKRAAPKSTAAFSKFISPDTDGEKKKIAAKPTSKDEANTIEEELEAMRLDADEAIAPKALEKKKTRKALKVGNGNKTKQSKKDAGVIDLTDGLNALKINENDSVPVKISLGRNKKARQTNRPKESKKEASATKIETDATRQQTIDHVQQTKQQSTPATPVRRPTLKAVVIPSRTTAPRMSLPPTPDSTSEPQDSYSSYVSPLLSLSYEKAILPFQKWSDTFEPHFTVAKIAEASFSEVYRLSASNVMCSSTRESVLKLVALRSPPNAPLRSISQSRKTRNPDVQAKKEKEAQEEEDEWKSHVDDVHSEVKLLQNLNYIPGFTNFRELTILQGRPSAAFVNAWRSWNKSRPKGKKSEFPDPSKKASYDDRQLWAVIEMQDAGTDVEKVMEKGGLGSVWEVWDVFWGVCLSVAKAEEACRFEHRDLHLENICIRSSRSESEDDLIAPSIKDPLRRKLGFTGLETTVIDYTLSRADVTSSSSRKSSRISDSSTASDSAPSTPSAAPDVAFLDLNKDMGLFSGDASEEYQYEIYRYMRGTVYHNDPLKSDPPKLYEPDTLRRSPRKTPQHIRFDDAEETNSLSPQKCMTDKYCSSPSDIWRDFHPKTNLVWAHFILHKLIEHLKGNEPANLSSKEIMRNVEAISEEKSKVARKALKLYKILEMVAELLEPSALAKKDGLGSMKELAVVAMEERWLRVDDVAGR